MAVDVNDVTIRASLVANTTSGAAKVRGDIAGIRTEVSAANRAGATLASEQGGLGAIEKRLVSMNKSAVTAGNSLKEMGQSIFERATEAAKRLAEALGLLSAGFTALGVESSLQLSRLNTSLTTYLGSATQAATVTRQIQSMALGSQSVGVLGQANTMFLSAGMDPNEALKLLGSVQNIAAAQPGNQGAAVSGLSSALNQVIGSQMITGRQLRQFGQYFDVYGLLSQQLGVPRSYVRSLLQTDAPAIGTQQFLGAIENLSGGTLGRYQGALGRYQQSPQGQIDAAVKKIEDTLANKIGQPALNYVASTAGPAVNNFIDKVTTTDWPKIASGAQALGKAFTADVMPALRSMGRDFGPLVHDFERLLPILPPLAGAVVGTGAALLHLGQVVASWVMPWAGPLVSFVLTLYDHSGPLKDVVAALVGAFVGLAILAKVKTWVTDLITPVKDLTTALLGLDTAEAGAARGAGGIGPRAAGAVAGAEGMVAGEAVAGGAAVAATRRGRLLQRLGGSPMLGRVGTAAGIGLIGTSLAEPAGQMAGRAAGGGQRGSFAQQDVADLLRGTSIGAAIGSIVPGVGTVLGGLGGALVGGGVAAFHQIFSGGGHKGAGGTHNYSAGAVQVTVNAQGNPNAADIGAASGNGVVSALAALQRDQAERA